jgi:hypothetical protein
VSYPISDYELWATIADWDFYDEQTRDMIREAHPEIKWDLTVDWTRVGDDLRISMGMPRIIKHNPHRPRRWWWPF